MSFLRNRLDDRSGFTLAELLITVVFIGLLTIAIGAGLSAALSAYGTNAKISNANLLMNRTVEEVSDQLAFALDVGSAEDPAGSFVSSTLRTTVHFENIDESDTEDADEDEAQKKAMGIYLVWEENEEDETKKASLPLIPAAHGLVPEIVDLSYNETANAWEYTINVKDNGTVVDSVEMKTIWLGK